MSGPFQRGFFSCVRLAQRTGCVVATAYVEHHHRTTVRARAGAQFATGSQRAQQVVGVFERNQLRVVERCVRFVGLAKQLAETKRGSGTRQFRTLRFAQQTEDGVEPRKRRRMAAAFEIADEEGDLMGRLAAMALYRRAVQRHIAAEELGIMFKLKLILQFSI